MGLWLAGFTGAIPDQSIEWVFIVFVLILALQLLILAFRKLLTFAFRK